jgi:predicted RNA-binding protein YlxR (DUF448 family)
VADLKTIRTCRNSEQDVLGDTHRRAGGGGYYTGSDRSMVGSRTCRKLCGGPIAKKYTNSPLPTFRDVVHSLN